MNIYKYSIKREFIVRDQIETYTINRPESIRKFAVNMDLHTDDQENFNIILLDNKNKIKGFSNITRGLLDRSHVHPREVFKYAVINSASKIILCHNHPSGEVYPSHQDIECTNNLCKAGEILGIKVVDHIIVGELDGCFKMRSMRQELDCEFV